MRQRLQQHKTRATATVIAVAISVVTFNSALLLRASEGEAQETASSHSLSFFADEQDAPILLDRLNADPEIAFIVPDGPRISPQPASPPRGDRPPTTGFVARVATCGGGGYWQRWRAVRPVEGRKDGEYILWHISAGPLVGDDGPGSELRPIPDPWAGWTSKRPLCGPNILAAATIRLNLQTRCAAYTPEERASVRPLNAYWINRDLLVASDLQWTGASRQPGRSLQTARWAAGFRDWFSRNAVALRARDSTEVFWAFPSGLQRLKGGLRYDWRNYHLDESIGPPPGSVKVIIEHYPVLDSQMRAYRVGARFKQVPGVEVAYKKSDDDVFDITVGDELKFSKKKLGRFPTAEEVKALAEEVERLATSAPRQ